jgi:hypothetical protein
MNRVTIGIGTFIFLLLFMVGGTLSAEPWEKNFRWVMERFEVTRGDQSTFVEMVEEAEQAGIPAEVLIPRIEEGVAKGIPTQRIIAVVEREITAYSRAKELIMEHVDPEQASEILEDSSLWTRTATLLIQKISEQTVSELLTIFMSYGDGERRWDAYRYGTSLYTALTDWGMNEQESMRIIRAVSSSSIPGDEYKGILDIIITGTTFRVSPSEMVDRIEQVANRVSHIEELQEYVLY